MVTTSSRDPAVAYVTRGTYNREIVDLSTITYTPGTEYEVEPIADNIVAATADKDELYSWVRFMAFIHDTASHLVFEWMLIKCPSADATQDLNDSDVVEKLHKDKRLFARGLLLSPDPDQGGPVKPVKFEVFNVYLPYGEELRLVIRPIQSSGGATGRVHGVLEWRQVAQ